MAQHGGTPAAVALQERESALSLLCDAVRGARTGAPSAVLLTGEAGAGKTALLEHLRARAVRDGCQVLSATCGPLEVDYPFGAVRRVLGRAVAAIGPGEPFGVLDDLYWRLAEQLDRPCLLVVDDVHWADEATLRWLHFLLHRLDGLPLLVALAQRPHGDQPQLLASLAALPVVRRVDVPLLSSSGSRRLLDQSAGEPLPEALLRLCHDATDGNPFYLAALARAVRELGAERVEAALSSSTSPLPVAARRAVLDRLHALGPDAVAVVRTVIVLGPGEPVGTIAEVAGVPPDRAECSVRAAQQSGLLRAEGPLSVLHPLVRDAVYDDLPVEQAATLHRDAARLRAATGAEPEQVAAHLVHTQPRDDIWVVESLLAGARSAVRRGAPQAAATYLRRALEEPLARRSPVLLLELGQAQLLAGDLRAVEALRDASALTTDDATACAAARTLARALVHVGDVPEAVRVLRAARDRVRDDTEGAVQLDLDAVTAARLDVRTVAQADALLAAYAGWSGERPCDRLVRGHLAMEQVRRGGPAGEAEALAREVLGDGGLLAGEEADGQGAYLPVVVLCLTGAVDEARRHLDAAVAQARARSSVLGLCTASVWRAYVALRAGDVVAAGADAEVARVAAGGAGLHVLQPYAVALLSDVLVERGDLAGADALWAEHGVDGLLPSAFLLQSRGALRLAQGRAADAAADLLEAGERQRELGVDGVAFGPWASLAALALHAQGEVERAARMVQDELESARTFGAARPLGIALHAAALLERGPARLDGLEQATRVLADSSARLDAARAGVDLGAAQVRHGCRVDGVRHLEEGLRRATACGATALGDRARAELQAAGVPVRRGAGEGVAALTISERRVAQLAADGRTNREIAQALFVTTKTVETHLARTFRKLGLASRRELTGIDDLVH